MSKINKLEELSLRASPSPWKSSDTKSSHKGQVVDFAETIAETWCGAYEGHGKVNADLIAEMRNILPLFLRLFSAAEEVVEVINPEKACDCVPELNFVCELCKLKQIVKELRE